MKASSRYVDIDDQYPRAAPRPKELPYPGPASTTASTTTPVAPPSHHVTARGRATAVAGVAAVASVAVLALQAVPGPATAALAAVVACSATLGGVGVAILLSWLAARRAGIAGLERVALPARDHAARWRWGAIPLVPHLGTRYLVRAMKQHPAVRYRYVLSFAPRALAAFVARAGVGAEYRLAIAAMGSQQRAQWYDGAGGGWSASFEAGVSAPDGASLVAARDAMRAALAGTFGKVPFRGGGPGRKAALLLGEELDPECTVPKELAPDVPSGVAVEAHAPVAMRVDVPLGKVVEPETLDALAPAGILHAHLDGGLVVAGGRVAERVALLKAVLAHAAPFIPVVIDDHGDFHVPGATVLVPGRGCTVNPLVPAAGGGDGAAARHASLVVAALAAVHAFTQEQEAFLATRLQELAAAASIKGLVPAPADLVAVLASDAKSQAEKAVALALQRDLTGWASAWAGVHDAPGIEAAVAAGKPVVVDLSAVPGAEKRALKAVLVLKFASLGVACRPPRPILAVVPDFDKVFHDERADRLPPRVAQGVDKVANALAASVPRLVLSVQDPARLPVQVLAHARAVVAFRQHSPQARDVAAQALGLEDEQLYDRSRHASYQHKYLSELPPGTCFLRRPDVPSPFLVAVDVAAAGKLLPPAGAGGVQALQAPAGDPLGAALLQLGLVRGDVVGLLDAMRRSGNQGVKMDWMADILAQKCKESVLAREPSLPARDAEARGRALAARAMEVLVARGIVAEDGYNPSGLKKGVTARLTQYGLVALDRASVAPTAATAMDPVRERVLSAERAIAEEYPNGDVAALGERLLSDMVALFQALVGAGDIEQHVDLLARSNRHAAALGEAMETRDVAAIKTALAPVINDLREVASLL